MTSTLIIAVALVALTLVGLVALRPFSYRTRIGFDLTCFVAISIFLLREGVFPVFPSSNGVLDGTELWLRAVCGAWWLLGARILVAVLWVTLHRSRRSREARLFSDLTASAIYLATALVVLNSVLALPVTGLLATSGIVAIVLALALQNTLADVFAGIAVGIEAPFGVGDRIQIDDKIEGRIVQVNWRSIRILTDENDVAIIPNSIVAKSKIVNRSFPDPQRAMSVEISCPREVAPERVIETLLHATLLCPDILATPKASAVLSRLGSRWNAYRVAFSVGDSKSVSRTKDQLLRAARRQLHYAGFLDEDGWRTDDRSPESDRLHVARRVLSNLIIFEGLADHQITMLAERLEMRRLEPDEVLFTQGEADPSLYVVVSGVLEFTRVTEMANETIGCIGAGEYVGEIGLLTGAQHAATARARTHCRIYQLPREAIANLLSENVELAGALDRSMRHGLAILHREVAVRATPDIGVPAQLLQRIRNLFHEHLSA
ncbi:mechanosensitive ion channel family protein [Methylobacterium nigriterrae]|uniref:mechanosensitive ion channel family protein n=1 Tax=Methylobacterium nigriterrae TaxID=3127512 RepID=UPI003013416A